MTSINTSLGFGTLASVTSLPTSRVSDSFARQQLVNQIEQNQLTMSQLEEQLSTGQAFQLPSDNPTAAAQGISINSIIQQQTQVQANLTSAQGYLNSASSTLANVATLVASIQSTALGAVGTSATSSTQTAAESQIAADLSQLLGYANTNFEGEYLFSGSKTNTAPYAQVAGGIQYQGNNANLETYSGLTSLVASNIPGQQAFGGVSSPVDSVALTPTLNASTQLSQLNGGQGVDAGSITVSNGLASSTVDLSGAKTLGDVVRDLETNPPTGSTISAQVTSTGLEVQLAGVSSGNLTISEVGSGTTAADLGILHANPNGATQIVGTPLNPTLSGATPLSSLLGTPATAYLPLLGSDDSIQIQAAQNGTQFNGVTVQYQSVPGTGANPTVTYNATNNTLTLGIDPSGATTTDEVIKAINAQGTFTASLDAVDSSTSAGTVLNSAATATTAGGSGTNLDTSGLQLTNGGKTYTVSLAGAHNVQDLVSAINTSGSGITASISSGTNTIDLQSTLSGSTFSIGENGGSTATQLGLRTLTTSTPLSSLNGGSGVSLATSGPDFTITRADGQTLSVSLTGAKTIGDVINDINSANPVGGAPVVAQLNAFGNGIQLVDDDPASSGTLSITAGSTGHAAQDLGLLGSTATTSNAPTAATAASATLSFPGANNDITITADSTGAASNGVKIAFINSGNPASATFDATSNTITFDVNPATTTANQLVALAAASPSVSAGFTLSLSNTDTGNTGAGTLGSFPSSPPSLAGGQGQTLTGSDVNPQQVPGLFSAVLQLQTALKNNDTAGVQSALTTLTTATTTLDNAQAQVGFELQSIASQQTNLSNVQIQLQSASSDVLGANITEVISNLLSTQNSYQASLQATGLVSKLSLLNYI